MRRLSVVLVAAIAVALLIWQISFRADSEAIDRRAPLVEGRTPLIGKRTPLVEKRTSLVEKRTSGTSGDSSEVPVAPAPGSDTAIEGKDASDGVPSEAAYLERLDRLNSVDKNEALDLVQRGEEWFGESGEGTEARRAMMITLLVDLGRMSDARDAVRRFIDRHPDSRYLRLVQGVTGIHPRPGPPEHVER